MVDRRLQVHFLTTKRFLYENELINYRTTIMLTRNLYFLVKKQKDKKKKEKKKGIEDPSPQLLSSI